jgi:hypothetical protein
MDTIPVGSKDPLFTRVDGVESRGIPRTPDASRSLAIAVRRANFWITVHSTGVWARYDGRRG